MGRHECFGRVGLYLCAHVCYVSVSLEIFVFIVHIFNSEIVLVAF